MQANGANGEWRRASGANSEWRMANSATAKGASPFATRHSPFASSHSPLAPELKARQTAQEFETMFLEHTLDRMFQSDGAEGPLGDNGMGGDVYRSMLTKEYAGTIAKSGGVGIADQIYREIIKLQEGGDAKRV